MKDTSAVLLNGLVCQGFVCQFCSTMYNTHWFPVICSYTALLSECTSHILRRHLPHVYVYEMGHRISVYTIPLAPRAHNTPFLLQHMAYIVDSLYLSIPLATCLIILHTAHIHTH